MVRLCNAGIASESRFLQKVKLTNLHKYDIIKGRAIFRK